MKKFVSLVALALGIASMPAAAAPTPTLNFELNGTYEDTTGSVTFTNATGSFSGGDAVSGGLAFQPNGGPSLDTPDGLATYSVEMLFSLDNVGSYRKLIHFKDTGVDAGFYIWDGKVTIYQGGRQAVAPEATRLANGQMAHLVLTRDASGDAVSAYLNGVHLFNYTDTADTLVFQSMAGFFHDEGRTGSETTSGFADFIRFYDAPLSGDDVSYLYNGGDYRRFEAVQPDPVTEPAMLGLLGLGALGIAAARRRRG